MQEAKELSFVDYVKSHENLKACWIDETGRQTQESYRLAVQLMRDDIKHVAPLSFGIKLKNGTHIQFAFLKFPDMLRGRQIDYLGCSRLVDNNAYNQFIRPCLLGGKKSIAIKASGVNAKPLQVAYSQIALHP